MANDDWIMGATAAQDQYRPVDNPWLPDVGAPAIGNGGQFSSGVPAVNRAADVLSRYPGHVMGSILSLPQRAFEASETRRAGGEYDPGPAVETALMTMGGGVAGTGPSGFAVGAGPIRMYHSTMGDLAKFGPVPEYRGATYLAQTPEGAMKGAIGGRQDFYHIPDATSPNWRTLKVDVPNEGIEGLHWTPEEKQWHASMPEKIIGDDALNAAFKDQPNYKQIPWDDVYEGIKTPEGHYEYVKKPPKEYTLEEAAKTNRDIYGTQIPGYNSGSDWSSAKRLREKGMKGFIVSDEGGVSVAHIDPQSLTLGSGATDKKAAAAIQGIRAYHSSPHDFDRFDLSKIGTGEGAQVYGHGLYFAENPAVSGQGGQYWNQFKNRFQQPEQEMAERLQAHGFDRNATAETIQRQIDELQRRIDPGGVFDKPHTADAWRRTQEFIAELSHEQDLLKSGTPVGPRTYEVNINAEPSHFLDWEKRLAAQPKAVKDIASEHWWGMPSPQLTGQDIYRAQTFKNPADTSKFFNEAGIPGIKYLDQGSRLANDWHITPPDQTVSGKWMVKNRDYNSKGMHFDTEEAARAALAKKLAQRTSNYVVFNPNSPISKVDILRKYGLAGAAPVGMGALAAQDDYRAQ